MLRFLRVGFCGTWARVKEDLFEIDYGEGGIRPLMPMFCQNSGGCSTSRRYVPFPCKSALTSLAPRSLPRE